jgi:hypothetical protein
MYGQNDGRKITINKPIIYSAPGDGSLKTKLTRIISSSDGQEKSEDYYSSYRSPSQFEVVRNPLE